jgi:hypothetical protein
MSFAAAGLPLSIRTMPKPPPEPTLFDDTPFARLSPSSGPLTAESIIRTETVLSRFPVHNLSKKGNVDIHILRRNGQGEVDIRWEVSYNEKHGQARQLAYKLDTIVINRRIEEEGRPLPKLIRLGSLRDIGERLDMGSNTSVVKRALRQNASAFITVKISYTNIHGVQKTIEADFTRYSVIFTGEKLPDKTRADAVYLNLNDVYWSMLNEAPWRPQDYDYLKALTPAAQRFYEIVSFRFYNAFKFANLSAARIAYSEYCMYSAQQRYYDYEHFKKQMYKLHQPHKLSGYVADVRYEAITDPEGRPDWMIWYVPGPKAQKEYELFSGQPSPLALEQNSAPEQTVVSVAEALTRPAPSEAPDPDPLLLELLKRGIAEKTALQLLASLKPGQDVLEQLEYADFRIASESSGAFRNPPGFYVSVIRDNAAVPKSFHSSRRRSVADLLEIEHERNVADQIELESAYEEYKRSVVDLYIQTTLDQSEYESIVERHKQTYVAQFRAAAQWPAATLHSIATNAAAVELATKIPMMSFEEFSLVRKSPTPLS